MQFEEIDNQISPADIIRAAFRNNLLDRRTLCVYAGLDDDGFARKRQCILNSFELKRRIFEIELAERNDREPPKFPVDDRDWNERIEDQYADYDFNFDKQDPILYRVLDDDGNVIGYYLIINCHLHRSLGDHALKSFVFADELPWRDEDVRRTLFLLLNRLSESKREFKRIIKECVEYKDAIEKNRPIEFDPCMRTASGNVRPKKAAYLVPETELDRYLIGRHTDARRDAGRTASQDGRQTAIRCPDGMTLE